MLVRHAGTLRTGGCSRFGPLCRGRLYFSSDDGTPTTKAKHYEHMAKRPVAYDHSMNARGFVSRLQGDTSVINFRITVHEQFGNADIVSEQRRTETWLKESQFLSIRKSIRITWADHEWRPGDDIETVYLKDGKLWTQQGDDNAIKYRQSVPRFHRAQM